MYILWKSQLQQIPENTDTCCVSSHPCHYMLCPHRQEGTHSFPAPVGGRSRALSALDGWGWGSENSWGGRGWAGVGCGGGISFSQALLSMFAVVPDSISDSSPNTAPVFALPLSPLPLPPPMRWRRWREGESDGGMKKGKKNSSELVTWQADSLGTMGIQKPCF